MPKRINLSGSLDLGAPKTRLGYLDIAKVRSHYEERVSTGKQLRAYLNEGNRRAYVKLALGIDGARANYSADEHELGYKILHSASDEAIFDLAVSLKQSKNSQSMVKHIYDANISNLKISVGSEMAMMLAPTKFWVANTRSVWAYLLLKHDFKYRDANEELASYRQGDASSEMNYQLWKSIYPKMEEKLIELGDLGDKEAESKGVKPGKSRYIWADAIANELYERRAKV
ncbi:hypothetical protein [Dyella sp. C9]|uniref:hypothetical protein n=1 Tax=Dyella sp. C9 TaxID=2202154 RepID=UPI0013002693|nr:hypothetical protein [Dyella sp. C9]